jgi:hypothetical protein
MTSQGSALARLKRSLDGGHLMMAEVAARELARVPLPDALRLCLLMDREDDPRFDRAAAKWLARFVTERPRVGFEDLRVVMHAFDALPDQHAEQTLAAVLDRHGLRLT